MFSLLGQLLPSFIYGPYQLGLAILLPLAVGGIALVDLDHFVHDLLEKDTMDNHAVLVEERIMHRTSFLSAQRAQRSTIATAYEEIAGDRTQDMIERVRNGDMSFGSTTGQLAADPQPTMLLTSRAASGSSSVWPVDDAL